ncbi:GNAT family N-acetyltransferase [Gorillibacterium timonense]|uniref:GNAT family N-acetyltransferase n=1 Tax=Gorillibacterium timonense TaxID=1689269 RepID=UPI00071CBF74|nr:GNAT family protein [Gorillibacterium timonense]
MKLVMDRLVIRNANAEDARTLCKWWNDGAIMAHAGFPNGIGTTEQEVLNRILADNDSSRRLILEVDGISIGEMSYSTVKENTAGIGIKICDFEQQEKGYGTLYLSMLIRFLFEQMGYTTIILDTNVKNKRAQHVYEKLGFRQADVRMDSWRDQLGEPQSFIDYELTVDDFKKAAMI